MGNNYGYIELQLTCEQLEKRIERYEKCYPMDYWKRTKYQEMQDKLTTLYEMMKKLKEKNYNG